MYVFVDYYDGENFVYIGMDRGSSMPYGTTICARAKVWPSIEEAMEYAAKFAQDWKLKEIEGFELKEL